MENASDWHQAHQNRSIRLGAMTLRRQEVKIGMGKSDFFYHLLWMLLSWQFQLAFAKHYGRGLLHQYPGHSPNLNLIENCWRPVPILIPFHPHFFSFHFIPFHSIPMPLPILIQTTCLWSVTAPKRIDQFRCDWPQSLAFFKLYMIHVKIFKIDQ